MRLLICFFCLTIFLFAQEKLEITAQKFSSDDERGITIIKGNVHIEKSKDNLWADEVIVYLDKNRKPQSYEAYGNVRFEISMENGREIKGHSDRLTYNAQNGEYRLLQNAVLNEKGKENTIRGEEIIVNKESGYANVLGSDEKPAKFIFNLDNGDEGIENEKDIEDKTNEVNDDEEKLKDYQDGFKNSREEKKTKSAGGKP